MDRVPVAEQQALARALAGLAADPREVERLVQTYRSGRPVAGVALALEAAARAYAAYRMPATFAGVRHVLAQAALAMPGFAPTTAVDLGAGTGASAWALAATWPTLEGTAGSAAETASASACTGAAATEAGPQAAGSATAAALTGAAARAAAVSAAPPGLVLLLEQAAAARALGETLAPGRFAWRDWRLGRPVPAADVACAAYVLTELTPADQARCVDAMLAAAGTVVVVEPGTPAGYRRVLTARDRLLAAGLTVAAPCPHDGPCPLADDPTDWCHVATRVDRSLAHRALKGGELMWEDEKVAYVVATREPVERAPSRVLRHPAQRKGLVALTLCRADQTSGVEVVSKRQGERFRRARDVDWGDAFS